MSAVLEQIRPETVERIASGAHRSGLSVDDFLQNLLRFQDSLLGKKVELTPEEKSRLWREHIDQHSVKGVIANDSRESIYTREDEAL